MELSLIQSMLCIYHIPSNLLTSFFRLQIIFSIRVPVTSTGAVNTDGVTDGLNNVVDEVAMANPGFEFSTVQRFGKIG